MYDADVPPAYVSVGIYLFLMYWATTYTDETDVPHVNVHAVLTLAAGSGGLKGIVIPQPGPPAAEKMYEFVPSDSVKSVAVADEFVIVRLVISQYVDATAATTGVALVVEVMVVPVAARISRIPAVKQTCRPNLSVIGAARSVAV